MKGFDTFKNALTFETNAFVFQLKRPCVLIKTLWRFILNAKVF